MSAHENAADFVEGKRHLSCAIVTQPIKLNPTQAPAAFIFVAHIAAPVWPTFSIDAEKFPTMEVEEGRGAFRVGAFRNHCSPPGSGDSSQIIFPLPVGMQEQKEKI
ncbi:MAG TPA: hypothetical protein VFM77_11535 [Terriglobales bacterium]|nr:hypothetical protein [Terriglobales bacterium]